MTIRRRLNHSASATATVMPMKASVVLLGIMIASSTGTAMNGTAPSE